MHHCYLTVLISLILNLLREAQGQGVDTATVSITSEAAFSVQPACLQSCVFWSSFDNVDYLIGALGCTSTVYNQCYCTQIADQMASSELSGCVNTLCRGTTEISNAISVYENYCEGAGYARTTSTSQTPSTTASSATPQSTTPVPTPSNTNPPSSITTPSSTSTSTSILTSTSTLNSSSTSPSTSTSTSISPSTSSSSTTSPSSTTTSSQQTHSSGANSTFNRKSKAGAIVGGLATLTLIIAAMFF